MPSTHGYQRYLRYLRYDLVLKKITDLQLIDVWFLLQELVAVIQRNWVGMKKAQLRTEWRVSFIWEIRMIFYNERKHLRESIGQWKVRRLRGRTSTSESRDKCFSEKYQREEYTKSERKDSDVSFCMIWWIRDYGQALSLTWSDSSCPYYIQWHKSRRRYLKATAYVHGKRREAAQLLIEMSCEFQY